MCSLIKFNNVVTVGFPVISIFATYLNFQKQSLLLLGHRHHPLQKITDCSFRYASPFRLESTPFISSSTSFWHQFLHFRFTYSTLLLHPYNFLSFSLLVHSLSIHFLIFCSLLLIPFFFFSFTLLIFFYCPSDPFLPESSHSVSRREVVGGDRTWV